MTLERKILTGFIACAFILFGVVIFSFNNSKKFIESNALVDHTNQVIYQFEPLVSGYYSNKINWLENS